MSAVAKETPDIETASESYAQRFAGVGGRYLLSEQDAAIRAVLKDWRGGTVLDVGGGHAQLTPLLRTLASDVLVFGSDARGLERVRRDFPDCPTATGDLLELPFATRSFDVVVAVRLLPHVRNWPRLLAELCRVARSTVVVDYPRTTGLNGLLTPFLFPLKKRLEGNTRHYRNFRDAEIDEVLHVCGFGPRERRAQFLLPMVVHRRANGIPLRGIEYAAKLLGITQAVGSPIVLRADRRGA